MTNDYRQQPVSGGVLPRRLAIDPNRPSLDLECAAVTAWQEV